MKNQEQEFLAPEMKSSKNLKIFRDKRKKLEADRNIEKIEEGSKYVDSNKLKPPVQGNPQAFHRQNKRFQQNAQQHNTRQSYYVPEGLAMELPGEKGGEFRGIISIICSIVSFFSSPLIFGIIGIFSGLSARKKGSVTLGTIGMVLSLFFMVLGMLLMETSK